MAMGIGQRGPSAEINVTPMIDVLLVLIIIFMIISPRTTGLEAQIPLPSNSQAQDQKEPDAVVLQVLEEKGGESKVRINQESIAWADLEARLVKIYQTRAERVLFVTADDAADFEQVARAIDTAQRAGIARVGLLGHY
jgi:biopolymer transport protein ExbD